MVKSEAERLVKEYCDLLQVDALGIMFIDEKEQMYKLKPLVYVKKANTLFWENSCASGSSAVGVWFAKESKQSVKLSLEQAGGDILEVNVDNELNVLLKGNIIFIGEHKLEI